ncbi:helix-turn-helix domain-containing protein [Thermopolyspora sp. NPDC052614]|uniref:helix-turn-helix domain-containing protein n=1 Tax=Thermopolyspora sp. NPDC052614 TaxID=3155682 RepID=UPI003435AC41
MDAEYGGISLGAWMELVRRARIEKERKLACLAFGSYANADGTGIFCGTARLAADCDVSYRTASRYLAWMREVGLVELVKRGNRRRKQADTYRLILGPQLSACVDLPNPDEYRKIVGDIAEANRADSKRRQRASREQAGSSTDTDDDRRSGSDPRDVLRTSDDRRTEGRDDGSTDTQVSPETRFYGHESPFSTDTQDVHPPSLDHLPSTTDLPWEKAEVRSSRLLSARAGARDDDDSYPDQNPDDPDPSDGLSAPLASLAPLQAPAPDPADEDTNPAAGAENLNDENPPPAVARPRPPRDDEAPQPDPRAAAARAALARLGDFDRWILAARQQLGADAPRDQVFILAVELAENAIPAALP